MIILFPTQNNMRKSRKPTSLFLQARYFVNIHPAQWAMRLLCNR
ncbi:MAG: hypothetical protein K0R10_1580 [Alphaproteobacteria bacterium]|jgi:hypothetical protein|nr:hypothetical protein [Alphaproteobacteria bacterium]